MTERSPYPAGLELLQQALTELALQEPKLLIGYNSTVLEYLNELRAQAGYSPITDCTLRLTYLGQLEGFGALGKHGPLYADLTPELLDRLVADRIKEAERSLNAGQ